MNISLGTIQVDLKNTKTIGNIEIPIIKGEKARKEKLVQQDYKVLKEYLEKH